MKIRDALKKMHRFDFSEVDRDVLGDVYQGYLPSDERKRLGEFYTPKDVIDYILDTVEYTPDKDIRGKTLLDPACGSGGFLVEATRRLIESYKRAGLDLTDPSNAKTILEEVVRCIYGLDIHPFACFIAEMNLLFQLIDLYDVARKGDKKYRLPRLNVYRTDSLRLSEKLEEALPRFFDNSRKKAYIEDAEGANIVKNKEFDFVVANPPYVEVKKIADTSKNEYRRNYETATGKFDLYVLFMERGIRWIGKQGRCGFIVSNKFMHTDYGRGIRKFILNNIQIDQIVDFGDTGVFAEVINYPCIIILSKPKLKGILFKYVKIKKQNQDILGRIRRHLQLKQYSDEYIDVESVESGNLSETIWALTSTSISLMMGKIKNAGSMSLGQICRSISKGIDPGGATEIFLVNEETSRHYGLEKEPLRPLLRGGDIKKWKIDWEGIFIIYPYKREDDHTVLVPLKNYPGLEHYLEEKRSTLENRIYVLKSGKKWYELWNQRKLDVLDTKKIVTPNISRQNNFALDADGKYFYLHTVYSIILEERFEDNYEYILGLLNSQVLEFFFKNITPSLRGGFHRYDTFYLEQLPIRLPQIDKEKAIASKIVNLVNGIMQNIKQHNTLKDKVSAFPNSYFKGNEKFEKVVSMARIKLSKKSYKISKNHLEQITLLTSMIKKPSEQS